MHFHVAGSARFICYRCTLCSLQRTQCVRYWLAVAQDVSLLHAPVSLLNEKRELWLEVVFSVHGDSPASSLCSCGV